VDRYQIFEQVALERLRSGSDATKPVAFLPLPVRLTALAAASITGLGLLWAVLARVPVQVNGLATIVPEGVVSSALARVDGVLHYQVSGVGPDRLSSAQRRRNQALEAFWAECGAQVAAVLPFPRLNALVLDAMAPAEGQRLVMPEASEGAESFDRLDQINTLFEKLHYPANTLIAFIDNLPAAEELDAVRRTSAPKLVLDQEMVRDRRERAVAYQGVDALLARQGQRQQQELSERQALYERLQVLWRQGYVSTASLLQEQATINGLKNQLLQLGRDRLNTDFSAVDQRQQSSQAGLSALQSTDQLQAGLLTYMNKTYTIAPPSGIYLVSRQARTGMQVRAGDELFTYSLKPPTLPAVIPVFVDAATVQQLDEGMSVLVTPKGVSRAQYGGIPGKVVEVGRLPLVSEGLQGFAGGRTLAAAVQQAVATPYLVRVRLEQAEPAFCRQLLSRRCYRWSASRVPPFPVRLGTQADVQITTIYRRPIEFVMPALRQALGLVVENR
jgi:hypothetical protein